MKEFVIGKVTKTKNGMFMLPINLTQGIILESNHRIVGCYSRHSKEIKCYSLFITKIKDISPFEDYEFKGSDNIDLELNAWSNNNKYEHV